MEQFPRSCCLYHPGEIITNFCVDKGCLMPLCPTCVCTHAQTHPNGRPNLAHINDIFSLCLKDVKEMLVVTEGSKLATQMVHKKINDEKSSWVEMIEKTKLQAIEIVDKYFQGFKKEVELGSEKQNKILGLHVPERIKELQKKINEQIVDLVEIKNDLFTDRSLSTLITFYHESKNIINKSQLQIQQQIKSNQTYSPLLVLIPDAFQKLKNSLLNFFNLSLGIAPSKTQRVSIRAQSPRASPSVMASPMPSLMQSPIQSVQPSPNTSRIRIESPFKNISNFNSTYPESQDPLQLQLQSKFNKTTPIKHLQNQQRSPRSSLGIKLMAQGNSSMMKKPLSIAKNKKPF